MALMMDHFHDRTATPLVNKASNEAVDLFFQLKAEAGGRACIIHLDVIALWSAQSAAPQFHHDQHKDLADQVLEKIRPLITEDCQGRA